MNLILLEHTDVDASGEFVLSDARAGHLLDVLKVVPGDSVRVGMVDGPAGVACVKAIAGAAITLQGSFESTPPRRPRVDLLLALPRPKVMRRLWAQIAAIGVGQVVVTNAARVERNYFDTHVLSPEFYRPLLLEGLQQARDTRVPVVSIHRQFRVLVEDALDQLLPDGVRVMADPHATIRVRDIVDQHPADRVLLAVGPEGGWNNFEATTLQAHGFHTAGMGPRTLRTDTACVALLALVHDAMRR